MKFNNPETAQLFADFRAVILESFEVSNESLPEAYRSKSKNGKRSLASIEKQLIKGKPKQVNEMESSVKFDNDRNIVSGSPSRLAAIEHYRKQVENGSQSMELDGGDEKFVPFGGLSEDKLYRAELNFAATLIKAGIMEPFEDNGQFDE